MDKKYYKNETEKAINNFQISGTTVSKDLYYSIAIVKKAAAYANFKTGRFDEKIFNAISEAVTRILAGEFDSSLVVDQIQGGAGTSTNMNVNEVISSVAEEILGDGTEVHPNDHVNFAQSTNDVVPTGIKLMVAKLHDRLIEEMRLLSNSFEKKQEEFKDIIKVGRTHLQDAVPMTLGQSFGAYKSFMDRNIARLEENKKYIYTTNLGGTAIGSAINGSKSFIELANERLSEITGYPFVCAQDLFDATQNSDDFLHIACLLKTFAAGLSKIMNDLRFLTAGPRAGLREMILPEVQKGSSIMPGKVNPVILEMMNQICYQVFGNVEVASHSVMNSQFELNVMLPIYAKNIFEAYTVLTNGLKTIREKAIDGLVANEKRIKELFDNSLCMATALNRYVGYDKTTEIVKRAVESGTNLIDEVKKETSIDEETLSKIFDAKKLTKPSDEFVSI